MMREKRSVRPRGEEERRLVFRVAGGEAAGRGLPLVVRSVGCYRVTRDFAEAHRPRWFTELFWTVAGEGLWRIDGTTHRARAGEFFIYRPGEPHDLAAGPAGWEYRWITFDGRDTLRLLEMFGLPRSGRAGACPEAEFDRVEAALSRPTLEGVREASVAAYAILAAAGRRSAGPREGEAGGAEAVRHELDACYTDADAGVETVAAALGQHRTTVLRAFTAAYGVTPSTYLARRRLQHALSLLRTTAMPVAEVAAAAGFRSPEYLARVVREETGGSPRAFRAGADERERRRRFVA